MSAIQKLGQRVEKEHKQFLRDHQRLDDRPSMSPGPSMTPDFATSVSFEQLVKRTEGRDSGDAVNPSWDNDYLWGSISGNTQPQVCLAFKQSRNVTNIIKQTSNISNSAINKLNENSQAIRNQISLMKQPIRSPPISGILNRSGTLWETPVSNQSAAIPSQSLFSPISPTSSTNARLHPVHNATSIPSSTQSSTPSSISLMPALTPTTKQTAKSPTSFATAADLSDFDPLK